MAALPCFLFWLTIMVFIWLFLLGWARIVSGHFFPTEIAMTLVVGLASLVGPHLPCVRCFAIGRITGEPLSLHCSPPTSSVGRAGRNCPPVMWGRCYRRSKLSAQEQRRAKLPS
jgi:hypothetical protein